jgi:AcrR family transcriptional regulator
MDTSKAPYHHGNLRQAVIDSAWETIQSQGIDKLSLRGCAREIGVDPAAIYQHFKSKNAILEEVARLGFVELADLMEDAEAAASHAPRAQLIAIGSAYVAFARANPQLFALMFRVSAAATSGATRGLSRGGRDPYRILTEARDRLADNTNASTASPFALWSAVHGLATLLNTGFGPSDDAHVAALVEELCNAMADDKA